MMRRLTRRNSFLLMALSMGFLYSSLYMGLIVVNLRGASRAGRGEISVLLHFPLVALAGLGLYFLVKKGAERLRALGVPLGVAGLGCILLPFLPETAFAGFFSGRLPLIALSMALFTPVSLFLFFRTVAEGWEGLSVALVMVASELLWALIFPLIGDFSPQPSSLAARHLFSLCAWMVGGAGLCLGATLALAEPEAAPSAPVLDAPDGRKKWAALGLVFAAGLGTVSLRSLHMGVFIPKIALSSELISIPHFTFLLLLPLAGRMMDTQPGKLMLLCLPVMAAIAALGLAWNQGLIGRMPLYYPLNFMQGLIITMAYAGSAKLLKARPALILLLVMAYSLVPMQFGGVLLRGFLEGRAYGLDAAGLLLALGTGFCLWRFRALLAASPELWPSPDPDLHKFSVFAAAHGLTARERDIFSALLRSESREGMGQALGLSGRTVRYHLTNLLKKTDMPNQKTLIDYYESWKRQP
ncbi:MAG: helix-turn-helix transcriptional regulator [Candidatus Adiutrix sp.]|jgi:DNA-binding CsgD family transcriptional regulator|nr:helix-turn-helix transcriptional regulator [Candidatus Adiutrix sp.]